MCACIDLRVEKFYEEIRYAGTLYIPEREGEREGRERGREREGRREREGEREGGREKERERERERESTRERPTFPHPPPDGYTGDVYLLVKMLLPTAGKKRVYNLQSKQMVKHLSQVGGLVTIMILWLY